jgi:hypothetical protein
MSALQQRLVSPEQAAETIKNGVLLAIAADETVRATRPSVNWIGGTIAYLMGQDGGITTRNQVFVTPLPSYPGLKPAITIYDAASLSQLCAQAPANAVSPCREARTSVTLFD